MRRRLLAPEVIQTSLMDCGPACLKSVLEGFGVRASYGRLREACQTDVDGTSIDTIEEIGQQLGLDAEQVIVPADHVALAEADALPAIAVLRMPDGNNHFVVAWRRIGPMVQLMDPSMGRRWCSVETFEQDLYVHEMALDAEAWREWAGDDDFLRPLRRRLRDVGVRNPTRLVAAATEDPGWRGLATLDASTRMVAAMIRAGALRKGSAAARMVDALVEGSSIPDAYWSVRPADPDEEGCEQVLVRGAVLVRVDGHSGAREEQPSSADLAAVLSEPPGRPARELWKLLRAQGILTPAALTFGLLLAASGLVVEALLFRGLFDVGRELGVLEQRAGAMVALLLFMAALLFIEFPIAIGTQRLGRQLEARLRVAFMAKLPRLGIRYFRSRPTSDMAERSHSIHRLRLLPETGSHVLRAVLEALLTTVGLIWLAPGSAPVAIALCAVVLLVPLFMQGPLIERNMRTRTHEGALSRFYLDALIGIVPVRTHGVERAMRREHEGLLVDWARAALSAQRVAVVFEGIQTLLSLGLAALLVVGYLSSTQEPAGVLLLVYWALTLPLLGQEIAVAARQYPIHRTLALRLMEPLGALEDRDTADAAPAEGERAASGARVDIAGATVLAGGHTLLEDVDLSIAPSEHVAVVGASGAGKSTLVGMLLGWSRPSTGSVEVDGRPLAGAQLDRIRSQTAWVDPSVQIWNRSVIENLRFGCDDERELPLARVIEQAELREVLRHLPSGMQTPLGESGGLVSGGEGQRVRLGRAMHRPDARLVVLDEPFRGLDREHRGALLGRARTLWKSATLVCVTHDIAATADFDRVVVVEGGRLVEQGSPTELGARPDSRYRGLLDKEREMAARWSGETWRRLHLENGKLVDSLEGDSP